MFTILIAVTSAVLAQAPHQQAIELLQDPRFANGVRVATRSHYPPAMQAETRERWRKALPATTRAAWEFIEIAELQNLSENPATPEVHGTRITYASRDRSKRLEVDAETGRIRFLTDTEREWRNGCNLSGLQDGVAPRFSKGKAWNWPHFLLSQTVRDPVQPDRPLPLTGYPRLSFRFAAELASCEMGEPRVCPPGSWGDQEIANHCLFYVAFVLVHQDPQVLLPDGSRAARIIYALDPVFCSWDGKTHSSPAPWLGLEPAGHAVYWTPNLQGLELGRRTAVNIDAAVLAREAIAKMNTHYRSDLSPDDYLITEVLIGWEIWGPFRCDIHLRDLSFEAGN